MSLYCWALYDHWRCDPHLILVCSLPVAVCDCFMFLSVQVAGSLLISCLILRRARCSLWLRSLSFYIHKSYWVKSLTHFFFTSLGVHPTLTQTRAAPPSEHYVKFHQVHLEIKDVNTNFSMPNKYFSRCGSLCCLSAKHNMVK